mgnify:CR=1 FL=1
MSDAPIDRRFQKHQVIPNSSPSPTPQDDLDVVAFIGINLRRNGAMSVGGHIGDKNFALAMIDNARDALLRQIPANENIATARTPAASGCDLPTPANSSTPSITRSSSPRYVRAENAAIEPRL